MSNYLLLDGDIIVYRFAAEGQTTVDMGDGDPIVHFDVAMSIRNCNRYIDHLVERFNAKGYVICVSDKDNFRKDVASTYKEARKDKEKPKGLGAMRGWLMEHPQARVRPRLEADDLQGILSTDPKFYPQHRKIIVSIDKDMQQIPGWFFNPQKDVEPRLISEEEGDMFFYTQVLTGDPVDGYKGCPGIGPKKAERILKDAEDPWAAIVETYEAKGLTADDALVQARQARILRYTDYDHKKKEPILWEPPVNSPAMLPSIHGHPETPSA